MSDRSSFSAAWARFSAGLKQGWNRLVDACYPFCYFIGIQTMRVAHRFRRHAVRLLSPVGRFLRILWSVLIARPIARLREEEQTRRQRIKTEGQAVAQLWKTKRSQGFVRGVRLPFWAVWVYRHCLMTGFHYVAPLVAVGVMAFTLQYWANATFALQVTYQDQPIGYIADESVFNTGVAMAESRVASTQASFSFSRTPTMTIAVTPSEELLSSADVCDAILQTYGSEVEELAGLYVDGTFVGALETEEDVSQLLEDILTSARKGTSKTETISFMETTEIVTGLYPATALLTEEELRALLTDTSLTEETYTVVEGDTLSSIARETGITRLQLLSYNDGLSESSLTAGMTLIVHPSTAYLNIQSVRRVVTTRVVAYDQVTVEDTSRYLGDDYIKVAGQNGEVTITTEIVTVDGEEVSRTVISEETTKEPVAQVYAKGAMNLGGGSGVAGDGIATGQFIWPIPGWYTVTSGYGYRSSGFHKGIDIYANGIYGAKIVAVDGGTVIEANATNSWGGGYGYYVVIDHGNGYVSRYSHCSAVLVSVGDKVSQGQLIAYVGRTGSTTGPGCHFEISRNGSTINPLPLLQ